MIAAKNIIPVWQPLGFSTHQIAKQLSLKLGVKTTHTGTLDPLAEGVILILCDEKRLKKSEMTSLVKGYEFEISFGLSTDSYDFMGFVTNEDFLKTPNKDSLEKFLEKLKGPYTQTVPIYSAIKVDGKRLFEWGHLKNDSIILPKKSGNIYEIKLLDFYETNLYEKLINLLARLQDIKGDFRQEGIIKAWEDYFEKVSKTQKIFTAKIYVELSRGLYVRSLSQDICSFLKIPGFVSSLIRVKNGSYTKNNCQTLSQIFGENYLPQEFHSKTVLN